MTDRSKMLAVKFLILVVLLLQVIEELETHRFYARKFKLHARALKLLCEKKIDEVWKNKSGDMWDRHTERVSNISIKLEYLIDEEFNKN